MCMREDIQNAYADNIRRRKTCLMKDSGTKTAKKIKGDIESLCSCLQADR